MNEVREYTETIRQPRCEDCTRPACWATHVRGYDSKRNPPYRFWAEFYCDDHLPGEAREVVVFDA